MRYMLLICSDDKNAYLIECDTRDEALEWAKKLPLVEGSFVDVRPIWQ